MLQYGQESKYKDFYQLDEFWEGNGVKNEDGIIPKAEYLSKLFMRKSGLPVLKFGFQMVLNSLLEYFYQQIAYNRLTVADLQNIVGLSKEQVLAATTLINNAC
jgi:sucrose phosphorylase